MANTSAWNTLAWFVALAEGLSRVGFVKWFAGSVAAGMTGYAPLGAMIVLVLVFCFSHYLFASVIAHVTAMLPVMLAVGATLHPSHHRSNGQSEPANASAPSMSPWAIANGMRRRTRKYMRVMKTLNGIGEIIR